MLNRIFRTRPEKQTARTVYDALLASARQAGFYADLGVPDTVEGRVEMVMLHTALVVRVLQTSETTAHRTLSQDLFDVMFDDFDSAMREMGVGDSGVGKKIRFLAEGFYGRAQAYSDAISAGDRPALENALARNLLAGAGDPAGISGLADYVEASVQSLAGQGPDPLASGEAPRFASLG